MRRLLIAFLTIFLAPAAFADHYSEFYVIPVASHLPGALGTVWRSDIAIQNFQSTPLTVSLVLIESGEGNSNNVSALSSTGTTIPAGGTVILGDVLGNEGNPELAGAIMVGADAPFAVTSRLYNLPPSGGTFGQTVPGVSDFVENAIGDTDNAMATAFLPGLINNSRFRTNIGFVAGTSNSATAPMRIQVSLKNAAGVLLGTQSFNIAPGGFRHLQFSSTVVASGTWDSAGAEIRIVSGDGAVVPYASVVDNTTGDAVFLVGQFPANTPFAKLTRPSVFRELFDFVVGK